MADGWAAPGDLTVSLLDGWELVAGGLVLLVVLVAGTVSLALLGAARGSRGGRVEWEAWLDGRSSRADRPAGDPDGRGAGPVR